MQKIWTKLFLASIIAFGVLAQAVYALDADAQKNTNPHDATINVNATTIDTEATNGIPASSGDGQTASNNAADNNLVKSKKVTLVIRINVLHNTRPQDSCRVYPYPVAPPRQKQEIKKLGLYEKSVRETLRTLGYAGITSLDKPYPPAGWRMQYAFRRALAKSGLGLPHTLFTMYVWIDEIMPYMGKEMQAINVIEAQRADRYALAKNIFEEHGADMEVEAFNQGLYAHDVPLRPWHGDKKAGRVDIEQGNWWIAALQKTPGLTYYWLWPVKLSDAPQQLVELNEDNAIHIDGGW